MADEKTGPIPVMVRLEPDDHARLEAFAKSKGLPIGVAVRMFTLERLAEIEMQGASA